MDVNSNRDVAACGAGGAPPPGVEVRAAAVCVRGARVSYAAGAAPVLDGLSMTVAEGSIYGLLGASGCGKTTLLTCIVGRRGLDEGAVRVLGLTPGAPGSGLPGPTVGYMPQELALHPRFTVAETFRYFGWISGMSREEVARRGEDLVRLLDLPADTNKLVGELSGGQQRRVSLGVALLNRPPVLILDEPTVGVEPTLRQSIWDLLLNETKSARTTVIITTHYIEEARQSDKVGLMRNGTLLDEDSPGRLLDRYGCATMEDVFLKLSVRQRRQQQQQLQDGASEAISIPMVEAASGVPGKEAAAPNAAGGRGAAGGGRAEVRVVDDPSLLRCKPIPRSSNSNIAACVWKMCIFTKRNKSVVVVLFALPFIISVLFGFAVGGAPKGLRLAVVNDDYSCDDGMPAFPRDCDREDPSGLSCRYLRRLSKSMFVQDDYGDVAAAVRAVRDGRAWGALHFPANYSHSVFLRHRDGDGTPDEDVDNSEVSAWLDMSNMQVSEMARAELSRSALTFFDDIQLGCKGNPNYRALPLQINEPIYGHGQLSFADFFAPAVILSIMYNINCLSAMAAFLDDKRDGFMERSIVSGVNVLELLGAHVIVDAVLMLFVMAITLVLMCGCMHFENNGPLWVLLLLNVLNGLSGMFQGYFIASMFSKDFEALICSMGFYFPTLMLSGLMWPLEGMHFALRSSVWLLPLNLATTAIRSVMARGWSVDQRDVYRGVLSSLAWLAFFVVITVATLRRKKNLGT